MGSLLSHFWLRQPPRSCSPEAFCRRRQRENPYGDYLRASHNTHGCDLRASRNFGQPHRQPQSPCIPEASGRRRQQGKKESSLEFDAKAPALVPPSGRTAGERWYSRILAFCRSAADDRYPAPLSVQHSLWGRPPGQTTAYNSDSSDDTSLTPSTAQTRPPVAQFSNVSPWPSVVRSRVSGFLALLLIALAIFSLVHLLIRCPPPATHPDCIHDVSIRCISTRGLVRLRERAAVWNSATKQSTASMPFGDRCTGVHSVAPSGMESPRDEDRPATPSGVGRPNMEDDLDTTLRGMDHPGGVANNLVTFSGIEGPTNTAATHMNSIFNDCSPTVIEHRLRGVSRSFRSGHCPLWYDRMCAVPIDNTAAPPIGTLLSSRQQPALSTGNSFAATLPLSVSRQWCHRQHHQQRHDSSRQQQPTSLHRGLTQCSQSFLNPPCGNRTSQNTHTVGHTFVSNVVKDSPHIHREGGTSGQAPRFGPGHCRASVIMNHIGFHGMPTGRGYHTRLVDEQRYRRNATDYNHTANPYSSQTDWYPSCGLGARDTVEQWRISVHTTGRYGKPAVQRHQHSTIGGTSCDSSVVVGTAPTTLVESSHACPNTHRAHERHPKIRDRRLIPRLTSYFAGSPIGYTPHQQPDMTYRERHSLRHVVSALLCSCHRAAETSNAQQHRCTPPAAPLHGTTYHKPSAVITPMSDSSLTQRPLQHREINAVHSHRFSSHRQQRLQQQPQRTRREDSWPTPPRGCQPWRAQWRRAMRPQASGSECPAHLTHKMNDDAQRQQQERRHVSHPCQKQPRPSVAQVSNDSSRPSVARTRKDAQPPVTTRQNLPDLGVEHSNSRLSVNVLKASAVFARVQRLVTNSGTVLETRLLRTSLDREVCQLRRSYPTFAPYKTIHSISTTTTKQPTQRTSSRDTRCNANHHNPIRSHGDDYKSSEQMPHNPRKSIRPQASTADAALQNRRSHRAAVTKWHTMVTETTESQATTAHQGSVHNYICRRRRNNNTIYSWTMRQQATKGNRVNKNKPNITQRNAHTQTSSQPQQQVQEGGTILLLNRSLRCKPRRQQGLVPSPLRITTPEGGLIASPTTDRSEEGLITSPTTDQGGTIFHIPGPLSHAMFEGGLIASPATNQGGCENGKSKDGHAAAVETTTTLGPEPEAASTNIHSYNKRQPRPSVALVDNTQHQPRPPVALVEQTHTRHLQRPPVAPEDSGYQTPATNHSTRTTGADAVSSHSRSIRYSSSYYRTATPTDGQQWKDQTTWCNTANDTNWNRVKFVTHRGFSYAGDDYALNHDWHRAHTGYHSGSTHVGTRSRTQTGVHLCREVHLRAIIPHPYHTYGCVEGHEVKANPPQDGRETLCNGTWYRLRPSVAWLVLRENATAQQQQHQCRQRCSRTRAIRQIAAPGRHHIRMMPTSNASSHPRPPAAWIEPKAGALARTLSRPRPPVAQVMPEVIAEMQGSSCSRLCHPLNDLVRDAPVSPHWRPEQWPGQQSQLKSTQKTERYQRKRQQREHHAPLQQARSRPSDRRQDSNATQQVLQDSAAQTLVPGARVTPAAGRRQPRVSRLSRSQVATSSIRVVLPSAAPATSPSKHQKPNKHHDGGDATARRITTLFTRNGGEDYDSKTPKRRKDVPDITVEDTEPRHSMVAGGVPNLSAMDHIRVNGAHYACDITCAINGQKDAAPVAHRGIGVNRHREATPVTHSGAGANGQNDTTPVAPSGMGVKSCSCVNVIATGSRRHPQRRLAGHHLHYTAGNRMANDGMLTTCSFVVRPGSSLYHRAPPMSHSRQVYSLKILKPLWLGSLRCRHSLQQDRSGLAFGRQNITTITAEHHIIGSATIGHEGTPAHGGRSVAAYVNHHRGDHTGRASMMFHIASANHALSKCTTNTNTLAPHAPTPYKTQCNGRSSSSVSNYYSRVGSQWQRKGQSDDQHSVRQRSDCSHWGPPCTTVMAPQLLREHRSTEVIIEVQSFRRPNYRR